MLLKTTALVNPNSWYCCAKDSLPHVGVCGYSWTWSLRHPIDCFEHRCWHHFAATWASARLSLAWEQSAFKRGLPATVRWHCGGHPPQRFGLDKLLRDHQPGDKSGSVFLFLRQRCRFSFTERPIKYQQILWLIDSFSQFWIQTLVSAVFNIFWTLVVFETYPWCWRRKELPLWTCALRIERRKAIP